MARLAAGKTKDLRTRVLRGWLAGKNVAREKIAELRTASRTYCTVALEPVAGGWPPSAMIAATTSLAELDC